MDGPAESHSPTKSGKTSSAEALLEHIGRYRITLRPVVARLFFDGDLGRASGALGQLQRKEFVQIHVGLLAGGYSYYQLTRKACVELSELRIPTDRAKPLKSIGLARSLGVLWFATMMGARRALLSSEKLPSHFPSAPGKAPHVGEILPSGEGRIYRLQLAPKDKDYAYPFSQIQNVMKAMASSPQSAAFVSSGAYAFAVLVNNEDKLGSFTEALTTYRPHFPPGAVVLIENVPSPENLPLYISSPA